jgi:hypothetical protein
MTPDPSWQPFTESEVLAFGTLTVPPEVTAKTAQKHDYPSAAHRRSYARRTGVERGYATAKDPATNDISRGWCRLMGLTPLTLFTTTLLIVRNQRILDTWNARQEDNARRATAGLPPKPAGAAARPSPASPQHRHSPATHANPGTVTTITTRQAAQACPRTATRDTKRPARHTLHPAPPPHPKPQTRQECQTQT